MELEELICIMAATLYATAPKASEHFREQAIREAVLLHRKYFEMDREGALNE
jgi:hypothetical protein